MNIYVIISILNIKILGIKRMLGIAPVTDPRQGQSFLGSLLSSGGWILPATGVAVAGVYREEISDIIEEIIGEFIS